MKKNIILVLSLVLALSLAGCGSKAVEEPKTEPEQEAAVEDIAPAPTEVTPEVVEEEPEAEEVVTEEPEVEDIFTKYDNVQCTGKDVITTIDEYGMSPIAILVQPGKLSVIGSDFIALNFGAILEAAPPTTMDSDTLYLTTFNKDTFNGVDKDITPTGDPYSLYKDSADSHYVSSIHMEGDDYITFSNTRYLTGENGEGPNGSFNYFVVDQDEPFKSELIKDSDGNTIGIFFISQYTLEEAQEALK